jgi:hypothetical protein
MSLATSGAALVVLDIGNPVSNRMRPGGLGMRGWIWAIRGRLPARFGPRWRDPRKGGKQTFTATAALLARLYR